jgi:hypothetical protein
MNIETPPPSPNFNEAPWTKYLSLSEDRLVLVADALRQARRGAVLRHEPHQGETPWSLGCVAYERSRRAIRKVGEHNKWLAILPESSSLSFSFSIGSVPVRFYRGNDEEPPSNYLHKTYAELQHIQLVIQFDGSAESQEHVIRVAVETDAEGNASSIFLVELDDRGHVTGSYLIPDIAQTNVLPLQPKPLDLAPPSIAPIQLNEQKNTGTEIDEEHNVG